MLNALSSRIAASRAAAVFTLACSLAAGASAQDAAEALKTRHAALAGKLADNPFKRPLHLESQQASDSQRGEIYAEVAYPFAALRKSMQGASQWCDILILHLNVKRCRVEEGAGPTTLSVNIGKKNDDSAADSSQVAFVYRLVDGGPQYFQVQMNAAAGPLGTRDYRIAAEAIPLGDGKSLVHMSYAYGYGIAARLAMQAYLATVGADKIGFSIVGRSPEGKPVYVNGVRGVVERNTMRYYLAIEAYLGALSLPAAEQPAKRIQDWFAATEEFAPQLHELSASDYMQMKKKDLQR